MVSAGALTLCIDARLLTEYETVLLRPRFGFDEDSVSALIDYIEATAYTAASIPLPIRLPDVDDEPFLEVALACSAEHLVTGNLAHFPEPARSGVSVLSPSEFLAVVRAGATTDGA